MNLKKLLFLACILVAASLYTIYVQMPKNVEESKKFLLFKDILPGKIENIAVATRKESSVEEFSLKNDKVGAVQTPSPEAPNVDIESVHVKDWEISGLPNTPLDTAVVSGFVSSLKDLKSDQSVDKIEDFSKFGLGEANLKVTVKELGKDPVLLSFGKANEYLSKRYLRVNQNSEIYLIPESSYASLNKNRDEFRSKTPIQFLDSEVKEVALTSSKGTIKIKQPRIGTWVIAEPKELAGSSVAISNLLFALKDLRVSSFVNELAGKDAEYGFDAPVIQATILFDEKSALKNLGVKIAKAKVENSPEGAYFTYDGAPSFFKLGADISSKFEKDADDLREKQFMKFQVEEALRLDFSGSDITPLVLENDAGIWKVNGKPSDDAFVFEIVRKVSDLEAASFPKEGAQYGFDKPKLQVSVRFGSTEEAAEVKTLYVGNEVSGVTPQQHYARVGETGEVFAIRDEVLKGIEPREETLVKPTPTPVAVEATPAHTPG